MVAAAGCTGITALISTCCTGKTGICGWINSGCTGMTGGTTGIFCGITACGSTGVVCCGCVTIVTIPCVPDCGSTVGVFTSEADTTGGAGSVGGNWVGG